MNNNRVFPVVNVFLPQPLLPQPPPQFLVPPTNPQMPSIFTRFTDLSSGIEGAMANLRASQELMQATEQRVYELFALVQKALEMLGLRSTPRKQQPTAVPVASNSSAPQPPESDSDRALRRLQLIVPSHP